MGKLFLLLSTLILVACSQSLKIQLDPEVDVFLSSKNKQTIKLTPNEAEYVALNTWLSEHSAEWMAASGRYSGGVYLTSDGYGIQVTDTHVVLYTAIETQPRAVYIQKIGHKELVGMKELGKNNK